MYALYNILLSIPYTRKSDHRPPPPPSVSYLLISTHVYTHTHTLWLCIILLLSSHNDDVVVDRKAVLGHTDFTPRRAADYAGVVCLYTHTHYNVILSLLLLLLSIIYIFIRAVQSVCVCVWNVNIMWSGRRRLYHYCIVWRARLSGSVMYTHVIIHCLYYIMVPIYTPIMTIRRRFTRTTWKFSGEGNHRNRLYTYLLADDNGIICDIACSPRSRPISVDKFPITTVVWRFYKPTLRISG